MKKNWRTLTANWRFDVLLGSAIAALVALYLFRLGVLTHRLLSAQEADLQNHYRSLHAIFNNPINAPYKLIDSFILHIHGHATSYARLTSAILAICTCVLFFTVMYRWHGKRIAILTSILFSTSGWMLHVGRLGNTYILFTLIPLTLLALAAWLNVTQRHGIAVFCMTAVAGLALYTPGAIWFLLVCWLLIHKAIANHVKHAALWQNLVSLFACFVLAGLLSFALYRQPHLIRQWLYIPNVIPQPVTIARQLFDSVTFLFLRGPSAPDLWLAHLPILDVFTSAMCLLGLYFYITHYKNLRTHVLTTFVLLGCGLVALNGAIAMGFLVPVAYLLAGTGMAYVLHQWLSVFPRNPVARGGGILLLSVVVACAVTYHLDSYFIAWRYNPAATATFREVP